MIIRLEDIQPTEPYLKKPTLDYFSKFPERLCNSHPPIIILPCEGMPFRYFVQNGNHRLYTLNKLNRTNFLEKNGQLIWEGAEGIVRISLGKMKDKIFLDIFEQAIQVRKSGIESWNSFKGKIVSNREYYKLSEKFAEDNY